MTDSLRSGTSFSVGQTSSQKKALSTAWQQWIAENKQRCVPNAVLIQTMVEKGIDLQVATTFVLSQSAESAESTFAQPQLSREWQQWVIENKRLNVSEDAMLETMVREGIDWNLAVRSLQTINPDAEIGGVQFEQSSHAYAQLLAKLESILAINRQLNELSPHHGIIERRSRISKQEFLDNYYAKNKPLILTDMMSDWAAMSQWSPDYLKQHYGEAEVEIQLGRDSDPKYEINSQQHKKTITLSNYIDMVVSGGETNDYYLVAGNANLERPDLKGLLNDIVFPEFLDPADLRQRVFFWFGPAGTITPLHHDPLNLMMAHISGRKRWRLISPDYTPLLYNFVGVFSEVDLENPDYETYPLFQQVKYIETVLEPGEIIFVPVGWWHQVKGLDVSLSVSFTNFAFPNQYTYLNPSIQVEVKKNDRPKSVVQSRSTKQIKPIDNSPTTCILPNQYSYFNPATFNVRAVQGSDRPDTKFRPEILTNERVEQATEGYLIDQVHTDSLLIIAFAFVSWDGVPQFDFYGRTKKLEKTTGKPINRILLRDFDNAWYHQGVAGLGADVDQVTHELKQFIQQISPSKVITIGQSMGAYAAIMFGQLIGADQVLAFGTLSFLHSQMAKEIEDTRWLPVMEKLAANLPSVRYFDLLELSQKSTHTPQIEIFYGKLESDQHGRNLDDFHAQRLAALPNCTIHPYEESGHAIVSYLVENKLIDDVLINSIFG